jgi:hypothetical protein
MREELIDAQGVQGDKWERAYHLVLELNLDLANTKMGEETMTRSFVAKCSHQTKAKMVVVKAEKATTKKAHKVKKLAKQVATVELGFTTKLSKTLKGEREETSRPLNPKSGEGGASTEKEYSKGEASKDNIQMVEQLRSTSDSSELSEEEEENP